MGGQTDARVNQGEARTEGGFWGNGGAGGRCGCRAHAARARLRRGAGYAAGCECALDSTYARELR